MSQERFEEFSAPQIEGLNPCDQVFFVAGSNDPAMNNALTLRTGSVLMLDQECEMALVEFWDDPDMSPNENEATVDYVHINGLFTFSQLESIMNRHEDFTDRDPEDFIERPDSPESERLTGIVVVAAAEREFSAYPASKKGYISDYSQGVQPPDVNVFSGYGRIVVVTPRSLKHLRALTDANKPEYDSEILADTPNPSILDGLVEVTLPDDIGDDPNFLN